MRHLNTDESKPDTSSRAENSGNGRQSNGFFAVTLFRQLHVLHLGSLHHELGRTPLSTPIRVSLPATPANAPKFDRVQEWDAGTRQASKYGAGRRDQIAGAAEVAVGGRVGIGLQLGAERCQSRHIISDLR